MTYIPQIYSEHNTGPDWWKRKTSIAAKHHELLPRISHCEGLCRQSGTCVAGRQRERSRVRTSAGLRIKRLFSLCLCVYTRPNGIIHKIVVTQHCTRWKNRSATSMSPVLNRRANRLPPTTWSRPWRTRVTECRRPSLGLPMPLLQPKTLLLKYVGECLWSQITFVFRWLSCVTVTIVSERTFE